MWKMKNKSKVYNEVNWVLSNYTKNIKLLFAVVLRVLAVEQP